MGFSTVVCVIPVPFGGPAGLISKLYPVAWTIIANNYFHPKENSGEGERNEGK